jgi:hypothetical protein
MSSRRPSKGSVPTDSEKETPKAGCGGDSIFGVQEKSRADKTATSRKNLMDINF